MSLTSAIEEKGAEVIVFGTIAVIAVIGIAAIIAANKKEIENIPNAIGGAVNNAVIKPTWETVVTPGQVVNAAQVSPTYLTANVTWTEQPTSATQLMAVATSTGEAQMNIYPMSSLQAGATGYGMGTANPAYGTIGGIIPTGIGSYSNPFIYANGWQGPGVYNNNNVMATYTNILDYYTKKAD